MKIRTKPGVPLPIPMPEPLLVEMPERIESSEELFEWVEKVEAEVARQRSETLNHLLRTELANDPDPKVRALVSLAVELVRKSENQEEQMADLRRQLAASEARASKAEAREDKLHKMLAEVMETAKSLAETNASLAAVQPAAPKVIEPDAVLDRAPEVEAVAKKDERGVIEKAVGAYSDAWKEHPVLMGAAHLLGIYAVTASSERDAALAELAEAEDSNADLWEDLISSQDEAEDLSAENDSQAMALAEAENRPELAASPTTEVHVHEASRLDDEQLEALGGRVDRAVLSELRSNPKRYRGEKGDAGKAGKAGKQGRDGRNAKAVRETKHVHHHHAPAVKSEAKPQRTVEVRHTTHVIKPTQKVGPMSPGTRRLIDAMNRLNSK